jgi:cysteine desulfurase
MTERVYLDWNATTPLRNEARTAMAAVLGEPGNPSSVHGEGRAARKLVEAARTTIANLVGATAGDVIFTSGATEANALALSAGTHRAGGTPLERLVISAIEHASVLGGGRFDPARIASAPVTPSGVVDLERLAAMLREGPQALVSVMLANNETGAIQPIRAVADLVHQAGGLLHVDAVQGFGKIPVNIEELGADLLSLSAHKLGGPPGTGALVLRPDVTVEPLWRGGGQERSRRGGTENVSGIVGFAAAAKAAIAARETEMTRLAALRDQLEAGLRATPGAVIFAAETARLPNTTLAAAPGLRAETALIAFDLAGLAVSSGSACSSGKVTASHVLKAMGVKPELAQGAVRLSLGWTTTERDIAKALEAWRRLIAVLPKGPEPAAA